MFSTFNFTFHHFPLLISPSHHPPSILFSPSTEKDSIPSTIRSARYSQASTTAKFSTFSQRSTLSQSMFDRASNFSKFHLTQRSQQQQLRDVDKLFSEKVEIYGKIVPENRVGVLTGILKILLKTFIEMTRVKVSVIPNLSDFLISPPSRKVPPVFPSLLLCERRFCHGMDFSSFKLTWSFCGQTFGDLCRMRRA